MGMMQDLQYALRGLAKAPVFAIASILTLALGIGANTAIYSLTRSLILKPVAIADPSVATDEQNNVEIYHAVSPGVVNVTNRGYQENFWGVFPSEGSGSGSIIDEKGDILTNYHVVQGASQLEVQVENDKFPATLIGADRDNDLAIIRIEVPRNYRLTVVKLGSSQGLQVGQKVLAIGNPFGLQRTLTTGIMRLERPLRDFAARRHTWRDSDRGAARIGKFRRASADSKVKIIVITRD